MAEPIGPRISGVEHKVEEIKRAVEHIANHRDGNQNVTNLRVEGVSSWQLTFCLLLTAVSALMAGFAMYTASDAKGELRTNNINRERDIGELRQTDNAIRAYINTGQMPTKAKEK